MDRNLFGTRPPGLFEEEHTIYVSVWINRVVHLLCTMMVTINASVQVDTIQPIRSIDSDIPSIACTAFGSMLFSLVKGYL